jgi:hypothetical protein
MPTQPNFHDKLGAQDGRSEGWRRFWKWFQILVVAPLFIYITIEALRMAWSQWFGQGVRE